MHMPRILRPTCLIWQAWSVAHTDESKMRSNRETLAGIAAILREYPALKITVHGETVRMGRAAVPL